MGRSFAFRDYYTGAKELEEQGIRKPYVSCAYRSESDDDFEIAISFAVHNAADQWVGLLAATLPTGAALGPVEINDSPNESITAALIAPRGLERDESVPNPEQLFILHRALDRGGGLPVDASSAFGTNLGGSATTFLFPVRDTKFSVLVRVEPAEKHTDPAPPR